MTNFAEALSAVAAQRAERPAVKLDDLVLTYGQLDDAAARVARVLRAMGVEPGDRVGLQLPTVPSFPIALLGVLRLGAVAVPMNPLLKEREVAYHLSDSGAKVMIAWHEIVDVART